MSKTVNIRDYIDSSYKLFINGEWTNGAEGNTMSAHNPSNGEKLADFIDASNKDVDDAVEAADAAFPEWAKISLEERSKILLDIANRIEANAEHLAMVESLDNGKPLRETKGVDIPHMADHFRYFAGVIRSEEGAAQLLNDDNLSLVLREPYGVVGQVIPWNFPLLMASWKIAPALATGNTIVITPSSKTSISILEFVKVIEDLLPAGVLNVITGSGSKAGDYMLNHEGIQKLAFTGSTKIGYVVAKAAADRLIPATLELGGKSANIVFDDAPWERAIEGMQMGILFNQGEVCSAGSRIFVQEGIYDEFVADLKDAFEKVKVGLPWEEGIQMGSQVNQDELKGTLEYIKIAKSEGATVLTGGHKIEEDGLDKGAFMAPTILTDVTNDMVVAQEEIFGPVVTVIKFKTEDEVIDMANDSEYGLGGGVWTTDIYKGLNVARKVRTGRMWVNQYNNVQAGAPFGGYKKSGIGRETYKSMIDAYSETKNIFINTSKEKEGFY